MSNSKQKAKMKKHILPITMTMIMSIVMNVNINAQSGIIGCFPLDNSPNDYSGNNNNGNAHNLNAATDRFGTSNYAYYFSGDSSAMFANDSLYRLNVYTYSVWLKMDQLPAYDNCFCIMTVGGWSADQVLQVGNRPDYSLVGFGASSYDSLGVPNGCWTGYLPNINQWYHLVVTRDNDSIKFYIDNSYICYGLTGKNAAYIGESHNVGIGARHKINIHNFIGVIDEVKIFDRALTASEVLLIDTSCMFGAGIDNLKAKPPFECYFNPVSKQIKMIYNPLLLIGFRSLEIYSLSGQKVFSADVPIALINAADLNKGMYLIIVNTKNTKPAALKLIVY